jgi:hypothetical protein
MANAMRLYLQTKERPRKYFRGPGFTLGIKDPTKMVNGLDAYHLARTVKKEVCRDFCKAKKECKDFEVNLTGWSRGAMVAVDVAKMLNTQGCTCDGKTHKPIPVNFVGLFDAVDMVMDPLKLLPGDQGFPNSIPPNVKKDGFAHAMKTGRSLIFPTVHFGGNEVAFDNYDGTKSRHHDLGYSATSRNNPSYNWMLWQAINAGVDF